MWLQITGKIFLALTPRMNHFWNITCRSRRAGSTTPLMPYRDRDSRSHSTSLRTSPDPASNGATETLSLEPRTVGRLLSLVDVALRRMTSTSDLDDAGGSPESDPVRRDVTHRSYDPRPRRVLANSRCDQARVRQFSGRLHRKMQSGPFFLGQFRSGRDAIFGPCAPRTSCSGCNDRESYSHEVISHGFWPGGGAMTHRRFTRMPRRSLLV